MPFAETETGARLFYDHLNSGAEGVPVMLLHGLLGTGRKHLGHVMNWLVEQGYEVIAPSLRGYGESTPKPRDFPMQFYRRDAGDILAFLKTIGVERCHVLGYSDGGEVALICAGTEPERFASVATIGSIGYMGPDTRAVMMNYRPGSQWIEADEIALHSITNPDQFSAQWVRSMVQLVDSGGDVAVSLAPKMTMPVLIMLGERDTLNPRKYAEHFLAGVADGRVQMFDAGHPVHDEQTEQFRQAFLAHLQRAEA
ncbi:MAG: alpha/beta fold hydrolase [Anaerolineae bacterium]